MCTSASSGALASETGHASTTKALSVCDGLPERARCPPSFFMRRFVSRSRRAWRRIPLLANIAGGIKAVIQGRNPLVDTACVRVTHATTSVRAQLPTGCCRRLGLRRGAPRAGIRQARVPITGQRADQARVSKSARVRQARSSVSPRSESADDSEGTMDARNADPRAHACRRPSGRQKWPHRRAAVESRHARRHQLLAHAPLPQGVSLGSAGHRGAALEVVADPQPDHPHRASGSQGQGLRQDLE